MLVTLMVTPGTTLPLGSVTVPFNAPVAAVCAKSDPGLNPNRRQNRNTWILANKPGQRVLGRADLFQCLANRANLHLAIGRLRIFDMQDLLAGLARRCFRAS